GAVTAIRHAWTFDDMYSAFATQGIETKTKGQFTRADLAPLAKENVSSLKEYGYFTYAKVDGKKTSFTDPTDYWLEFEPKEAVLTLHFTLPFAAPVKAKDLNIEVYDNSFFVDFAIPDKESVALVGAPAACKLAVARPVDLSPAQQQRLSDAFFSQLDASNYG